MPESGIVLVRMLVFAYSRQTAPPFRCMGRLGVLNVRVNLVSAIPLRVLRESEAPLPR